MTRRNASAAPTSAVDASERLHRAVARIARLRTADIEVLDSLLYGTEQRIIQLDREARAARGTQDAIARDRESHSRVNRALLELVRAAIAAGRAFGWERPVARRVVKREETRR